MTDWWGPFKIVDSLLFAILSLATWSIPSFPVPTLDLPLLWFYLFQLYYPLWSFCLRWFLALATFLLPFCDPLPQFSCCFTHLFTQIHLVFFRSDFSASDEASFIFLLQWICLYSRTVWPLNVNSGDRVYPNFFAYFICCCCHQDYRFCI